MEKQETRRALISKLSLSEVMCKGSELRLLVGLFEIGESNEWE